VTTLLKNSTVFHSYTYTYIYIIIFVNRFQVRITYAEIDITYKHNCISSYIGPMKFNIETFLQSISDPITKSISEYFKTRAHVIQRRPIVVTSEYYSWRVYIFHCSVVCLPWPVDGQFCLGIPRHNRTVEKRYVDWTRKGIVIITRRVDE